MERCAAAIASHLPPRPPPELESRAEQVFGHVYVEEDPTVWEELHALIPSLCSVRLYFKSLFPFVDWMPRYNLHWLLGDALAGLTVGLVVVPQAMAYAILARLTPEHGLYTSFSGAAIYWIFGTSKDIVIGTTAIGSLLVGSIVTRIEEKKPKEYDPAEIATTVSLLAGFVLLFVGFTRLGWIVDFIPYISISAFVTAAAITIISTQFSVLLGIKDINTREAPYLVILNTLKGLPRARLDAAIGISSLVLLMALKELCSRMETRHPSRARLWGVVSSMRFAITIILATLVGWLVHRSAKGQTQSFRLVGKIESGFKKAGVPTLNTDLAGLVLGELPAMVIILVIEHIAIAKSFGKQYGYRVIPSQEIIAQGAANLLGPFVGGYVCTGSFGASAVLSKAGVRTPLGVFFSAIILIIVLYALTGLLFYIPMASLAALIIHATTNLITTPPTLYKYWTLSPLELIIWVVGLLVALFDSLEMSIYCTIGISLALLLIRMARVKGLFLGQSQTWLVSSCEDGGGCTTLMPNKNVFLPIARDDGSNTDTLISSPHPGVFVYRFRQPFNYINQAQQVEHISSYVLSMTSPSINEDATLKASDRLWIDRGTTSISEKPQSQGTRTAVHDDNPLAARPVLRSLVLDFSAVYTVDITSVQGLQDLRHVLDRHAGIDAVEWHFSGVYNRWARRTLVAAGFGFPSASEMRAWTPVYAVTRDCETAGGGSEDPEDLPQTLSHTVPLFGVTRQYMHADLETAVAVAVRNAKRKEVVCHAHDA